MMHRPVYALFLILTLDLPTAASADQGPHLDSSYQVPKEYQAKYASATDHSVEDAPVLRYSHTYEAYWWNCVAVKAANLDDRCPFLAGGWPAEAAGALDGAGRASDDIHDLLKKYDKTTVQAYLRKLVSTPSMLKAKLGGWFDRPTPDPDGD